MTPTGRQYPAARAPGAAAARRGATRKWTPPPSPAQPSRHRRPAATTPEPCRWTAGEFAAEIRLGRGDHAQPRRLGPPLLQRLVGELPGADDPLDVLAQQDLVAQQRERQRIHDLAVLANDPQ